jgi:hypothetical protein
MTVSGGGLPTPDHRRIYVYLIASAKAAKPYPKRLPELVRYDAMHN